MFATSSGSHLLLLLLCSVHHTRADLPGVPVGQDYLVQIQTLTRHTDRAAQNDPYITEAAPEAFFRGPGELSTEGVKNAQVIGSAYRRAYVDRAGFLDGRYNPTQTHFQASGVDRVLMTAASFSSGLFRDDEAPVMAPVYTVPYAEDTLLAINYGCLSGWDDVIEDYNLTASTNMPNDLLAAMRAKDWHCAEPPAWQSDTLLSEFANSRTNPELTVRQKQCARVKAKNFMFDYIHLLSGSGTNDTRALPRIRRSIGHLADVTVNTFKEMRDCLNFHATNASCDPTAGIAQFRFSHDVNVLALMDVFSVQSGSLDFFQGKTPAFGVSLVAELWVRDNIFFVKMFVLNGADSSFKEFFFCDFLTTAAPFTRVGRYCTLQSLEEAKNLYINSDPVEC